MTKEEKALGKGSVQSAANHALDIGEEPLAECIFCAQPVRSGGTGISRSYTYRNALGYEYLVHYMCFVEIEYARWEGMRDEGIL